MNKAIEVFSYSANRRGAEENHVDDAALCHGSAVIVMMFTYMYKQTKREEYLQTCAYWIEITLQLANHSDGVAGYKKYRGDNGGSYVSDYSLLEGASGIGLMLMSYLDSSNHSSWMPMFLLI